LFFKPFDHQIDDWEHEAPNSCEQMRVCRRLGWSFLKGRDR
jgi:hypothetical protein